MQLFEYVNFLPEISDELLITDVNELYKRKNYFSDDPTWDWWYFITPVDDSIYTILQPYFDFPVQIFYQLSGTQLTPHIDVGREFCYNYILLPGGPSVKTRWYNNDGTEIIYETVAAAKKWHRLQVDVTHDISEIESPRLSLTLCKK